VLIPLPTASLPKMLFQNGSSEDPCRQTVALFDKIVRLFKQIAKRFGQYPIFNTCQEIEFDSSSDRFDRAEVLALQISRGRS
jgi:hypothetical protein